MVKRVLMANMVVAGDWSRHERVHVLPILETKLQKYDQILLKDQKLHGNILDGDNG